MLKKILLLFLFILYAKNVFSSCENIRPANSADVNNGSAVELIIGFSSACSNNSPAEFFELQTRRIVKNKLKLSIDKQIKYIGLICGSLKQSFKNPEAIVYSIEVDTAKECGKPKSLLWGKYKTGKPVFRMAVAIEDAKLKLNEN